MKTRTDIKSSLIARAKNFCASLTKDSRGNTLAMAGAALLPIAAMIGSGLDMSRAYTAQAKLQNACDAAALATRREMEGTNFSTAARREGERFFDFNFPEGTMDAQNVSRVITQASSNSTEIVINASADIPTTIMALFGKEYMPVSVECNADRDLGHNDVMLVLDVTGSMNSTPSGGGSTRKIELLRDAAGALYRALDSDAVRTRFGMMPYSQTVNVGAELRVRDILRAPYYWQFTSDGSGGWDVGNHESVNIQDSQWASGTAPNAIRQWQNSGEACIEERPSYGNAEYPIVISRTVTQDDIDQIAGNTNDRELQWGWYDADEYAGIVSGRCPAPASRLTEYASESAFNNAIDAATANVGGNTYHDLGMVWGIRFLSSTGMFASDNDTTYNGFPVRQHIVFLTDGIIATNSSIYTSFGINQYDGTTLDERVEFSSGSRNQAHIDRFLSACTVAKSMGMTVWVIALDVSYTADIEGCATDDDYFYQSDGSDLEQVFSTIGSNIAALRLSR